MQSYAELIEEMLAAKLKSGKPVVNKPEHVAALTRFAALNPETDWIEGKELTQINKIVTAYLPKCFPALHLEYTEVNHRGERRTRRISLYDTLQYLTPEHWEFDSAIENAPNEEKVTLQRTKEEARRLLPLHDHYLKLDKRRLRGGVKPKAEREKEQQTEIKGKMDPRLREELERMRDFWKPLIYDYALAYLLKTQASALEHLAQYGEYKPRYTLAPVRYGQKQSKEDREKQWIMEAYGNYVHRGVLQREEDRGKQDYRYVPTPKEELERMATETANTEANAWFFKMSDKLGGFITDMKKEIADVRATSYKKETPFESGTHFEFTDGSRFTIYNSIERSTSTLGTPFFRYPARFTNAYLASGQKIEQPSEYSVKAAFLAETGLQVQPKKKEYTAHSPYTEYSFHFTGPNGEKESERFYSRQKVEPQKLLNELRKRGIWNGAGTGWRFKVTTWNRRGLLPLVRSIDFDDVQEQSS